MSSRILSALGLSPPSLDRARAESEVGCRGLDDRFISFLLQKRLRAEGQWKSSCPCRLRSRLINGLPCLRPFPSFPANRSPRVASWDRIRIHRRAGSSEFRGCRKRATHGTSVPARDGGRWSILPARCEEDLLPIPAEVSVGCLAM